MVVVAALPVSVVGSGEVDEEERSEGGRRQIVLWRDDHISSLEVTWVI